MNARCLALLLVTALGVALPTSAGAHEPGNSAVLVDLSDDGAEAQLQLPLDGLSLALGIDLDEAKVIDDHQDLVTAYIGEHVSAVGDTGEPWTDEVGPLAIETIDGLEHLTMVVTLTPPSGEITDFTLHYDVILEEVVTHDILVTSSINGGDPTVVASLDFTSSEVAIGAESGAASNRGFTDVVDFGFEHVLEGADHLLFLVVLLLPAPAIIGANGRWVRQANVIPSLKRIVGVATAFTAGHALTIVLSIKGGLAAPSGPVEIVVALSVIAGAFHAWRPIIRHGEAVIAGTFGLVHGLAFAGLLDQLGLGTTSWATLAAFNLGVELAQLATIALTFPLIYLVSRTRHYDRVRAILAAIAGLFAVGWAIERIGLAQSPFGGIEAASIEHPLAIVAACAVLATGLVFESNRADASLGRSTDES